jgi:hypothetical protein
MAGYYPFWPLDGGLDIDKRNIVQAHSCNNVTTRNIVFMPLCFCTLQEPEKMTFCIVKTSKAGCSLVVKKRSSNVPATIKNKGKTYKHAKVTKMQYTIRSFTRQERTKRFVK